MKTTWTIVESGHRWLDLCRSVILREQARLQAMDLERVQSPARAADTSTDSISDWVPPRLQSLNLGQAVAWHQEPRGGLLLLDGSDLTISQISAAVFRCRYRDPRVFFVVSIPAFNSFCPRRSLTPVRQQLLELGVHWCVSGPEAFLLTSPSLLHPRKNEQTGV